MERSTRRRFPHGALACACFLAVSGAAAAQAPSAGHAIGHDAALAAFSARVERYAATRARLEAPLPPKATVPRSPAAAQGCESCHGPGEKHVEDPSADTGLRKFAAMATRDVSATCLSCHTGSSHALWQGSAHDSRNLSCVTCHSVHAPKSSQAQLKAVAEVDLCATCHRTQALKVKRVSHMPVQEGKMQCSSCHNPHGSTNVKNLRVGNWVNESCVSCHTEKRGPFLFEHAAGRESCISCHDPHGSSNDRMLVAKVPMLCQRCHIGTRHPSTIYDDLTFQSKSVRVIGRGCVNCHSQIHGSNHPSGQAFVR